MDFFYQYTILDGTRWCPVEHASAVVLHLGLLEVKVLGLVVRDPNLELLWLLTPVLGFVGWPGKGRESDPLVVQRIYKSQGLLTILMHIEYIWKRKGENGFIKLLANFVISEKNIEHL